LVQRANFLIEPRHLRSWRIGAAQLIECLTSGEFNYFSHRGLEKQSQREPHQRVRLQITPGDQWRNTLAAKS